MIPIHTQKGCRRMQDYLRNIQEADKDLLFAWANEEEVRKNSFSGHKISYEEHCRWFLEIMQNHAYRQYIYMSKDVPVGQIRLHITGDTAEVSYSIGAGYRGRGYAKKMLACLCGQVTEEEPQIRILTAKVKAGNNRSKSVFLNAGFSAKYELFALELEKNKII